MANNGFTRQSTFADTEVIEAADHNNEYDALATAFSNTLGHAHDGSSNQGPVINVIGDSSIATPLNKVLIDTANDNIGFWVDVSSSSTEQIIITDGTIEPVTNNDIDLGSSSKKFKDLHIAGTATLTTPQINDTSSDHQYIFAVSELVADRTVTLPLLTGNDTFVFNDFAATLTNKTINLANNTVTGTLAEFNTAISDATVVSRDSTDTLTNKSINLANNTVTGTLAEFNTACSNATFVTTGTSPTLTGLTLSGDLVMGSGDGIDFSATSDATGMASELLDDYEEGTFTPAFTDWDTYTITYGTQTGNYTKIGNVCYFDIYVTVTSWGTYPAATYLFLEGLPFNAATPTYSAGCTIGYATGLAIAQFESLGGYVSSGTDQITLQTWDGTTGISQFRRDHTSPTFVLQISGKYRV
jgi:hypothetical protein